MEHQPSVRPPAAASAAPAPAGPATGFRPHWTPARQRAFLAELVACGSVAQAARAVGMSRSSAHRLRRRLAGTPFDRTWEQALAMHAQSMADPLARGPAD